MKCQDAEHLILLQDSGEMAEAKASPLAAHLHDCDPCQQFQHAMFESKNAFDALDDPNSKLIQDILIEARLQAPEKKKSKIILFRPAWAAAACLLIGLGIFFTNLSPNKVGMELMVTDTQMLKSSDQMASVMYDGISDDDMAFNFLMTYEDTYASL